MKTAAFSHFALFDSSLGSCAIVWNERGILGVQLPERDEAGTRARVKKRFPAAEAAVPPVTVQQTMDGIVALLRGERTDLSDAQLDMSAVPAFNRRVYEVARGIAPGATLTYGEIAALVGEPGSAVAIGQAMGANPFPIIVPCHRVLAAGGKLGGFSAPGGAVTKLRLLTIEGAEIARQVSLPL